MLFWERVRFCGILIQPVKQVSLLDALATGMEKVARKRARTHSFAIVASCQVTIVSEDRVFGIQKSCYVGIHSRRDLVSAFLIIILGSRGLDV